MDSNRHNIPHQGHIKDEYEREPLQETRLATIPPEPRETWASPPQPEGLSQTLAASYHDVHDTGITRSSIHAVLNGCPASTPHHSASNGNTFHIPPFRCLAEAAGAGEYHLSSPPMMPMMQARCEDRHMPSYLGLAPHMAPDGAFPLRNPSRPTGQYDLLHFPSQENAYADDHAQAYPPSMPAPRMLPPTMDPSRLLHRQISMPAIRAESVSESELEMDDGGESDHGWDRQLGKDDVAGWGRHPDTIGIDIPVFHDKKTKGDVRDAAGIQVPVVMHARFVLKKRAARQRHFMILYRRNYFGIQASYNLVPLPDSSPNETLYLYRNHHKPKPIQAMFMCMRGVVETEEGPEIKIVVFNAKRKPLHEGKEPPPIEPQRMKPLTEGSTKYYSESTGNRQDHIRVPMNHTFHRNQFRAATQNNGARRTEQQTYHILLELKAEIIVGGVPELFTVASRMSEPLVVRGRCPLSFKAKDDHAPDHDRKGSNPSGDRGRRKGKGRSTTQSQKEGQAKGAGRGPCNKTGGSSSRRSTRATSLRTEAPEFQDLGIL